MATEDGEGDPDVLQVVLRKVKDLGNAEDYVSATLHLKSLFCLLLTRDGCLCVNNLDGQAESVSLLGRVIKCFWVDQENPPRFLASTADQRLVWASITAEDDPSDASCPPRLNRLCSVGPFHIKRKAASQVKGLSFKKVDLVGLCHGCVVLQVDAIALLMVRVGVPQSPTPSEEALSIDVISCCMLRLPSVHDFSQPLVVLPSDSRPLHTSLLGSLAVVVWSGGLCYTFCNLDNASVLLVVNVGLTLPPGASLTASAGKAMKFNVSADLKWLSVWRGQRSDGSSPVHIVDLQLYIRRHPGHVNPLLRNKVLQAAGQSVESHFTYLASADWNEETADRSLTEVLHKLPGDKLWHEQLNVLRCSIDNIGAHRLGILRGAGSKPPSAWNDDVAHRTIQFLQGLCSSQRNVTSRQCGSDNIHSRQQQMSTSLMETVDVFETLLGSMRLGTSSTSSLHLWERNAMPSWHDSSLLLPTEGLEHLVVSEVVITTSSLFVLLLPKPTASSNHGDSTHDLPHGALVIFGQEENAMAVHGFKEVTVPVRVDKNHLPYCLLTSQHLYMTMVGMDQEEIVNKLILYENALLAELLCRLNHWERCSLPLTALESALRHRQLDSVAFFLNSQDSEVFKGVEDQPTRSAPKLAPAQVEIAVQLLTDAVERNAAQQNSRFCQQLLRLALSFLHWLMETAVEKELSGQDSSSHDSSVPASPLKRVISPLSTPIGSSRSRMFSECSEPDLSHTSLSLQKLANAAGHLRQYVKDSPQETGFLTSENDESLLWPAVWDEMEEEEVISDGITQGRVAAAQSFLINKARKERIEQLQESSLNLSSTLTGKYSGASPAVRSVQQNEEASTADLELALRDAMEDGFVEKSETGDSERKDKDGKEGGHGQLRRVFSQEYFNSGESAESWHTSGILQRFLDTGSDMVLHALMDRNCVLAIRLARNMGCDVKEYLRRVCFHTISRPLRDYLVDELQQRDWLSADELLLVDYLHLVERLYPVQSYSAAKAHGREIVLAKPLSKLTEVLRTFGLPSTSTLDSLLPGGHDLSAAGQDGVAIEMAPLPGSGRHLTTDSQSRGGYAQLCLQWIMKWDSHSRERVLLEQLVSESGHGVENAEWSKLVSAGSEWYYHLSRLNTSSLVQCLRQWLPSLEETVVSVGVDSSPVQSPSDELSLQPLWNPLPKCPLHVHELVLDELASHGVFINEEQADFPSLLRRLSRNQLIFQRPFPLESCGFSAVCQGSDSAADGRTDQWALLCSEYSLSQAFHRHFVHFCVKHHLSHVLCRYFDFHGLADTPSSLKELGLDQPSIPNWLHCLVAFRLAAKNSEDPAALFQASLSNARLRLTSSHQLITLTDMLTSGYPLMALATLMYAKQGLDQILDQNEEALDNGVSVIDLNLLAQAVVPYPQLKAALFPSQKDGRSPADLQDVTLYQLLQGNALFDPAKLFRWQSTNTLAPPDSEDVFTDMPHFSHPDLVSKFGHCEHLSFLHYLRNGQPNFGLAAFLLQHQFEGPSGKQSCETAGLRALRLAVRHFTDAMVTSACAAFCELVGVDSSTLRVTVEAANRVLTYRKEPLTAQTSVVISSRGGHQASAQDVLRAPVQVAVAKMILSALNSKQASVKLEFLTALEEATRTMIFQEGYRKISVESAYCWQLVLTFCRCHQLPLSTSYLIECAEQSSWLALICHAQQYQFPPGQVLDITESYLGDVQLREHLRLVLSNLHATPQQNKMVPERNIPKANTEPLRSVSPRTLKGSHEVRANFYSRMGLQQSVDEQPREEPRQQLTVKAVSPPPVNRLSDVLAASPRSYSESLVLEPALVAEHSNNLFDVLFVCDKTDSPWRSLLAHAISLEHPLLAILAACYKDHCPLECLCVWLCAVCGSTVLADLIQTWEGDVLWRKWSLSDFAQIVLAIVARRPSSVRALTLAFHFFDPDNIFACFVRFHESFVLFSDFTRCEKELSDFMEVLSQILATGDVCGLLQLPSAWLQDVTVRSVRSMLCHCADAYQRRVLISMLARKGFGRSFKCDVPDFGRLHQLQVILCDADVDSDLALGGTFLAKPEESLSLQTSPFSLSDSIISADDAQQRAIQLLVKRGRFTDARRYARLLQISTDVATFQEVQSLHGDLVKSMLWQREEQRIMFWHSCSQLFKKHRCQPTVAAKFFEDEVKPDGSVAMSYTERAHLLGIALHWNKQAVTNSQGEGAAHIQQLQRSVWLARLRAEKEQIFEVKRQSESSHTHSYSVSSVQAFLANSDRTSQAQLLDSVMAVGGHTSGTSRLGGQRGWAVDLGTGLSLRAWKKRLDENKHMVDKFSDEDTAALDSLIDNLLALGHLSQACNLALMFGHASADLNFVLLAVWLASGQCSIADVCAALPKTQSGRVRTMSAFTPTGHLAQDTQSDQFWSHSHGEESLKVVRTLETVIWHSKAGKRCCQQVAVAYQISKVLVVDYQRIVCDGALDVLGQLLTCGQPVSHALAKSFTAVCGLSEEELVQFVGDAIVTSLLTAFSLPVPASAPSFGINLHSSKGNSEFSFLASLCTDQAKLAERFMTAASDLTTDANLSQASLACEVECLVRAHTCYTAVCNMEGIGRVLRTARQRLSVLTSAGQFQTVVHLLTGIGRYREMLFVFESLVEHGKLDLLLRRNVTKDDDLKVVLLEFLRKHCPENMDTLSKVALHFSMWRELAVMQEKQADRRLAALKTEPVDQDMIAPLEGIVRLQISAAENYIKDNCLRHAQSCMCKARLAAMQRRLISQGVRVVNLDSRAAHRFMCEHSHFHEAMQVAEAYRTHGLLEWVKPVYIQVVQRGHFRYLQDLSSSMQVSAPLFREVAARFLRDSKEKDWSSAQRQQFTSNVRELLEHVTEPRVTYQLAKELGFTDMTSSIFDSPNGQFLRDHFAV